MLKETEILLTTKDNPYNPFTEYDDWKYFDEKMKHYNTEAYIAREVGMLDPDISDEELAHERVTAFKEIIKLNNELGYDIYTMISRDGNFLDPSPSDYLNDSPEDQDEIDPEEDEDAEEVLEHILDTPGGGSEDSPTP